MTEKHYAEVEKLGSDMLSLLADAYSTGDPSSELAQRAAALHRSWLSCYMDNYSKEIHAGLTQMYVDDPRFTAYYDKKQPGTATFLRDAILIYTGMKN